MIHQTSRPTVHLHEVADDSLARRSKARCLHSTPQLVSCCKVLVFSSLGATGGREYVDYVRFVQRITTDVPDAHMNTDSLPAGTPNDELEDHNTPLIGLLMG